MLTIGSLFSGIGGFDLGLERAGMRVIWQSEIDTYASAVLKRHWPTIPNLGDIRGISSAQRPDVICGGFPCQPFSSAARGRNLDGNLWPEMYRVVDELRPTWVIGENVTPIDGMALRQVEADLEASGYAVKALEIPACAVGLDHKRSRYWILGYADCHGQSIGTEHAEVARLPQPQHEPARIGTANGVSGGLDANRRRCLGNAIVPQIAEIIGRAILSAHV